jgi:hypothetical protein
MREPGASGLSARRTTSARCARLGGSPAADCSQAWLAQTRESPGRRWSLNAHRNENHRPQRPVRKAPAPGRSVAAALAVCLLSIGAKADAGIPHPVSSPALG